MEKIKTEPSTLRDVETDEVTVLYDYGTCFSTCGDTTTELVRVKAGLVEWEFTTCMTCGATTRTVTEFDEFGGIAEKK